MSAKERVFIDTNILIYRSFGTDSQKEKIQNLLLKHAGNIWISSQVLNEFINTAIRKNLFNNTAQLDNTLNYFIRNFSVAPVDSATVLYGTYISRKYHLSHYDSVIAASALENKCQILFSEDMQHNQVIEARLKVVNPFK